MIDLTEYDLPKTGVYVHNSFWQELLSYRPTYWTWLPFTTRQYIIQETIWYAGELLERPAYLGEGYEYYKRYKGHAYALKRCKQDGQQMFRAMCKEERYLRQAAIDRGERIKCGARRKIGKACKHWALPGKNRCKHHGGMNTGPKTIEGRIKQLSALPQYKRNPELLAKKIETILNRTSTRARNDNGKSAELA